MLEVITPILKLCSRVLTSTITSDWWDAILKGERRPIDPARIPPNYRRPKWLYSFHRRPPEQKVADPADWDLVSDNIEFTFANGVHPIVGYIQGQTICSHDTKDLDTSTVILSYQEIEPLMPGFKPPLSKSERLL